MFDPAILEACTQCLVGAAMHDGGEIDLRLGATALARDLADTHGREAGRLLDEAAKQAVSCLDASDLSAAEFAASLRRLSSLRARVDATLAVYASSADQLAA